MTSSKIKSRFDFLEISILGELDNYKEHINKIDRFLTKEVTLFESKRKATISRLSIEHAEEYLEYIEEIHWELVDTYPAIQRKSELISIYTVLENSLNQLCFSCEKCINDQVKMSDLSSNNGVIGKSQKYLEKVVGINFPSKSDIWIEIKNIQEIRNAVVHNNSVIKNGNAKLRGYIKHSKYLSISEKGKIEIESGFNLHCLSLFKEFFNGLFLQMT